MKQKLFTFLSLFLFLGAKIQAQATYNTGDITAITMVNASHDSTTCESTAFCNYNITINNSFIGDVVTLKDQQSGTVYFTETNTTGQNPWIVFYPGFPSTFTDDNVPSFGGMAVFFWPDMKIICGTDTIYNIYTNYQIPVPDPCGYGTVSGKVYLDYNNDCIFNNNDVPLSNIISNGFAQLSSPVGTYIRPGFSDVNGNYSINMQNSWMTSYQVYLSTDYSFIFPSSTCSPLIYNFNTLPQPNVDFSLQCSSVIDVQGSASHPVTARPNIPFFLHPKVSNTGCDSASGILTLIKDPNTVYDASLSTNPATTVNGDTLKWNYSNLTNLSNGAYWNSFVSGVHLTPNNSVNIGDTLCFSVSTTLMSNDLDATNNQYSFCMPVVNSYDPNAKEVMPKGVGPLGNIPPSTNELTYTIQFQNTGTAPAFNVSIIDTLDTDIDPKSLKFLGSSHSMTPEWLATNIVKFNFYNINLADSFSNEPASHGQVMFKVKLKPGLAIGTQIKNTGHIYFDNNPAIVTNTTLNTIAVPSAIDKVSKDGSITIFPNPANDMLNIKLNGSNQEQTRITISSLNAQIVKNITSNQSEFKVNIDDLIPGMYFIQIFNGENSYTTKLMKN